MYVNVFIFYTYDILDVSRVTVWLIGLNELIIIIIIIPVIIEVTGTISKSFRKYVSNIPRKHDVKELQKTAILGTAHILHKVLI